MSFEDMVDQLSQCDVAVLRQGHDLIGMRFKVMGSMITAPSTRSNAPGAAFLVYPFDRR